MPDEIVVIRRGNSNGDRMYDSVHSSLNWGKGGRVVLELGSPLVEEYISYATNQITGRALAPFGRKLEEGEAVLIDGRGMFPTGNGLVRGKVEVVDTV